MIISHIIGGLGNQMFQYSVARALALQRGVPLYLDNTDFEGYGLHQGFELNRIFSFSANIATQKHIINILGFQAKPVIQRVVSHSRIKFLRRNNLIIEPSFGYWPGISKIPTNSYLKGYWQSEKYFCMAAKQIREDFAFRLPMTQANIALATKILELNSVSLHVRRGDYASDTKTATIHGLCDISYYRTAVDHILSHVENPFFFIFSDDMSWVKNNLNIDIPCEYVSNNHNLESYNDMRLMSLCKHHVIANSSFSWWGAWLNPSESKIVIAPKKWFVNNVSTSDIIPETWLVR